MLRIRLLGDLTLEAGGRALDPPPSRPARELLAWLALHPGPHAGASSPAASGPTCSRRARARACAPRYTTCAARSGRRGRRGSRTSASRPAWSTRGSTCGRCGGSRGRPGGAASGSLTATGCSRRATSTRALLECSSSSPTRPRGRRPRALERARAAAARPAVRGRARRLIRRWPPRRPAGGARRLRLEEPPAARALRAALGGRAGARGDPREPAPPPTKTRPRRVDGDPPPALGRRRGAGPRAARRSPPRAASAGAPQRAGRLGPPSSGGRSRARRGAQSRRPRPAHRRAGDRQDAAARRARPRRPRRGRRSCMAAATRSR